MQKFLKQDLKNTEQPIGFISCSSLKQHSIYRLLKNTVFTRPLLKLLLVSVCEKEHSVYMWKSVWNVFPSQRSKQGTSKTSRGRCASIFVGKAVSNWLWPKMHLQMCVEVTKPLVHVQSALVVSIGDWTIVSDHSSTKPGRRMLRQRTW